MKIGSRSAWCQNCALDEIHVLFFRRGIEEVARHGADSITAAGHRVQTIRLLALVRFTDYTSTELQLVNTAALHMIFPSGRLGYFRSYRLLSWPSD